MDDGVVELFPEPATAPALVIGTITPSDSGEGEATFTVNPNRLLRTTGDAKAGCQHLRYTLEERWHKVTCTDCKTELSPFAVLQRYAEWEGNMLRQSQRQEQLRANATRAQIRMLRDRVALEDEDRAEIDRTLRYPTSKGEQAKLDALLQRLEAKCHAASRARVSARRKPRAVR